MSTVLNLISSVIAAIVTLPIVVVFVECWTAVFASWSTKRNVASSNPDVAILIPAHNETAVIGHTLSSLMPQLNGTERVIVIADNCSDDTAEIARAHGATVIERQHATERGKGYALDFGLEYLAPNPPDVVLMLDADCVVEPGGIPHLTHTAYTSQRPVQAIYLQNTPTDPSTNDLVSAFAFLVKNKVRPSGLHALNQPILLTGTGMAAPWDVIRAAPLASGNIVEDMQLGLDLAIAGHAPKLVPEAVVWGDLPQQKEAATTQRTRWEHGHLNTLFSQVPRLTKESFKQRRLGLLALALELMVPPLALLVMLWVAASVITGLFGIIGGSKRPAVVVGSAGVMLFSAIGAAWARFGRNTLPLATLLKVPLYIAWKIPLYLGFVSSRQTDWVRTERDMVDSAEVHKPH